MSGKVSIQENGELNQLESDLGVDNLSTATYVPVPPSDCAMQYPDPLSEGYKQCVCEEDPDNCPENVLYFFHSDQLGSSSVLTDATGNPYQFLVYFPWGEVLGEQKAASFSTPYQFNGKELDQETGLYNYGARYYDPSLSLWLGVDPLTDHPNQIGMSPYNYAWNNPINLTDPDGRCPKCPEGADVGDTYDWGGSTFTFGEGGWSNELDEVSVSAPRDYSSSQDNLSSISIADPTLPSTTNSGVMGWLSGMFGDGPRQQNSGSGAAIFGKGSRNGSEIKAPYADPKENVIAVDISDIYWSGASQKGKFIGLTGSKDLKYFYNLFNATGKLKKGLERIPQYKEPDTTYEGSMMIIYKARKQ